MTSRRTPRHGRNSKIRSKAHAKRYLAVGGGAVTERQYFEMLNRLFPATITYRHKNNSPSQLASYAAELKRDDARNDSTDDYAQVWVVVDVDQFQDLAQAQTICDENGMELIVSNPCFEVWLLDHVRACPSSFTTTPVVEQAAARAQITQGNRNKYIAESILDVAHMDAAMRNARRHNTSQRQRERNRLIPRREEEFATWTDMVRVVEELLQKESSQ